MILPTTVGDVAGLVIDADGLVTRDVGESDVVIRLVIPGWRRLGKSSFMMSCSFNGKTSNQGSLALRPSPTWAKGLRSTAATPGSAVPESSSC